MAASSTTDILLESRRRAYLSALGIPLYHPRKLLPGALPSSLLAGVKAVQVIASPAAPVQASVQPTPVQTTSAPAAPVHAALAHLQAATAPVNKTATPAKADGAVVPKAESELRVAVEAETQPVALAVQPVDAGEQQTEALAFAFAFVPVNEQVAVINELPWAGSVMLTPGSRQLLAGILKALTLSCEERHLSSLNFVWPLPDMPPTEQGPALARELLKGFLAQRFKIRPVRYLLVFAEHGAPYLFPDGFDLPQQGSVFRHPDFDVNVLVTRSLGAMEAVPALKRDVWAALQPLLAALKHNDGAASAEERQDP